MEYTEPRIVTSNDLKKRSYVVFYANGERYREPNGKCLGLNILPNLANNISERNKLLRKLQFEIRKALESNTFPFKEELKALPPQIVETSKSKVNALEALKTALQKKLNSNLSKFYKRNLNNIYKAFIEFLSEEELANDIALIKSNRIEDFLFPYRTSGTYYMNKRRDLGVLFSTAGRQLEMTLKAVLDTEPMKSKAKLHKIYEKDQIKPVLKYLKSNNSNLHLCCLLTYGCFLRPHEEVRKLFKYHFKKDLTEIHLSGDENKGGRVRIVYVPDYVRVELIERIDSLKRDENIFSMSEQPFNEAYFNTAWTRAWRKMKDKGIIELNQTIYSFRHTAAVNIYRKTKDLHLLQQMLGHSDMIVTLKYLRGLGEVNMDRLKEAVPDL